MLRNASLCSCTYPITHSRASHDISMNLSDDCKNIHENIHMLYATHQLASHCLSFCEMMRKLGYVTHSFWLNRFFFVSFLYQDILVQVLQILLKSKLLVSVCNIICVFDVLWKRENHNQTSLLCPHLTSLLFSGPWRWECQRGWSRFQTRHLDKTVSGIQEVSHNAGCFSFQLWVMPTLNYIFPVEVQATSTGYKVVMAKPRLWIFGLLS